LGDTTLICPKLFSWDKNLNVKKAMDLSIIQITYSPFYTFKSFALIATIIVLKLIKIAPTAGMSMIPIGANTPAANGIAAMLYPAAHHKFYTIF